MVQAMDAFKRPIVCERSVRANTRVLACRIEGLRLPKPEYVLLFSSESSFTSNQDFSILYKEQEKIANEYKGVYEYESYIIRSMERYCL